MSHRPSRHRSDQVNEDTFGFTARMNALVNLSVTCGASAPTSIPCLSEKPGGLDVVDPGRRYADGLEASRRELASLVAQHIRLILARTALTQIKAAAEKGGYFCYGLERIVPMDRIENSGMYVCPMHSAVHQVGPGKCPQCGMDLLPEGTRFALLRHMTSNPLHLIVMAAAMAGLMVVAMMLMR
jgi:hypothetical protein